MTYPYRSSTTLVAEPSLGERIRAGAIWTRDTLDQGGRPLWIAVMIAAFVIAAPLGFAILFYMLWSKRMFGSRRHHRHHDRQAGWESRWEARRGGFDRGTGNAAFDAYREETLRRLEDEHAQFLSFLGRLREARDKAEFDQFMKERQAPAGTQPEGPAQA